MGECEEHRGHQHTTHHDRVVAGIDRVHDHLADTRPRKDDLSKNGARDEASDSDTKQCDGRKDGKLESIDIGDTLVGKAICARHPDVVLAHHLQHGGPDEAGKVADPAQANGKTRQHQMKQLILEVSGVTGADGREDLQFDGEQQQGVEANDEGRDGDAAYRKDAAELVGDAVAVDGGITAHRDAQQDRPAQTDHGQGNGMG